MRTLTKKGLNSYELSCSKRNEKLLRSTDKIQHLQGMSTNTNFENSGGVSDIETQIQEETKRFRVLSIDFRDFLHRTNTLESKQELERLEWSEHEVIKMADETLNHLASVKSVMRKPPPSEKGSCSSKGSSSKASSKLSAVVAMKRAKAGSPSKALVC